MRRGFRCRDGENSKCNQSEGDCVDQAQTTKGEEQSAQRWANNLCRLKAERVERNRDRQIRARHQLRIKGARGSGRKRIDDAKQAGNAEY